MSPISMNVKKILLIIGSDKIGRKLIYQIQDSLDTYIYIDKSTNISRIFRLLMRGRLNISLLLRMFFAELFRRDFPVRIYPSIYSINDLMKVVRDHDIRRIYLFRAGLIMNREVINAGAEILNVHCARLPEYSGIGSISRALKDKAFNQEATLHRVTSKIDEGEVINTKGYALNSKLSYRENEDIAYDAGIDLLLKATKQKNNIQYRRKLC